MNNLIQTSREIDYRALSVLTPEQAHQFRVIPLEIDQEEIHLYGEAVDIPHKTSLQLLLGKKISIHPLSTHEIEKLLSKHYPFQTSTSLEKEKVQDSGESDVAQFINKVLEEAARMGVSDVHIERYELEARIRFRWEGQLIEKYDVPLSQYNALISRIKILAELDISERRLPQDGRIHLQLAQKEIDVRVSTLPGKYGEKTVLRLLTRSDEHLDISALHFTPKEREAYQRAIHKPNGIILITGPTGSGKTTTLYGTLSKLNRPDKNILTIEDPIEYNFSGINQVQLKEEIGLNFDRALRAFLRQDPDIIMVGEIRDQATAEIAIRTSLAGRLVFSTLHTNSSWDAITRLTDMGIESYLLASSLRLVLAQRLARVLCPSCKKASNETLSAIFQDKYDLHSHYIPQGCSQCYHTGYKGRQAVFEVLPITRELKSMIKSSGEEIDEYMQKEGIASLADNLAELVRAGITSVSEALLHVGE